MYTGGELILSNYNWNLKSWDGKLLATQNYMVSSQGEAARQHSYAMGRYTLCQNFVTPGDMPVYKHDGKRFYIYRNEVGDWCVGDVAGYSSCSLIQKSNMSPFSP